MRMHISRWTTSSLTRDGYTSTSASPSQRSAGKAKVTAVIFYHHIMILIIFVFSYGNNDSIGNICTIKVLCNWKGVGGN